MLTTHKEKEEKINIEEAYKIYKEEAGEQIEEIELKKSFFQKYRDKVEQQADIKRKIKSEQRYSDTDRKLEKMRMECESIQLRQRENPNYILSKVERRKQLAYMEAERKAKLKKQDDEKKELLRKAKRMKRRRSAMSNVPKSVQETIPYIADYEEGIFEILEGVYSKTFEMQDINYQVSKEAEQIAIFCKYGEFLNYFSEDMLVNISIVNKRANQENQEDEITFKMRHDNLNEHRKEYNRIIMRQLASGKNDMIQNKYVTITQKANNPFEAVLRFHRTQQDVINNLQHIGANSRILSTTERLSILHDIFRPNNVGAFRINYDFIKKQGISSKDYVAPASFFFDRDYFQIDGKYYRVMFLNNLPASITDDFIAKISNTDFPCIINIMVHPVEQAKGLDRVNKQITGMEAEKRESEDAAIKSGYITATISHDLEHSLTEAIELRDDMINKNQKSFLTSITVMVCDAMTMEELNENCDTLKKEARKYTCTFQTLNYQQEEGMYQSLLLGHNALLIDRTLTTESLSIFIPFTCSELFQPGGFYYGINSISKNLILSKRVNQKSPHGFVLGSTGSGKSFAVKREMLNVILNMSEDEADLIVIDPDNEYVGFISAFGDIAEIIDISANSTNYINPLDLSKNYSDDDADPMTLKSQFVMSLVEGMMSVGDTSHLETIITPMQRTIVDRALRHTYGNYLRNDYNPDYQPTLVDFQSELNHEAELSEEGNIVAQSVEYYTKGSMNVFAHRTNVDLKKRLIVFTIRDLGGQLRQIGLSIILDFIWNRMVQNSNCQKLTFLYMDEVQTVFANEFSANYIENLFKRGRKYGLVITGITQDVEGLLASPNARKMISNSGHIIMLNQSDSNLEELATMLHLSDSQRNYVTMSEEGCGLLFAEKVIVPFNDSFPKDSYLYKLMSTKFGENFNIEEGDGKLTNEDATELRKRFKLDELKQKQLQRKEKDNVAEKEQREEKTDIINDVDENIKVENKTIHQDIQQLFKTMDGNGELLQPEGVYYGINPSSKNLVLSKELEQSTHREETTLDFEKNSGLSKEDRGNEMQDSPGVHETEEDGGKQNKVDEILQDMPDDMRSILLDRLLKNEK